MCAKKLYKNSQRYSSISYFTFPQVLWNLYKTTATISFMLRKTSKTRLHCIKLLCLRDPIKRPHVDVFFNYFLTRHMFHHSNPSLSAGTFLRPQLRGRQLIQLFAPQSSFPRRYTKFNHNTRMRWAWWDTVLETFSTSLKWQAVIGTNRLAAKI